MTSSSEADPSPKPAPKMSTDPIVVAPHSGETSLKLVLVILGALLWVLIIVSMVGAAYALFFGVFFFVTHMIMIAHIRGSSVKLGPKQMSGLYNRVVQLSERIGLKKVPDAYLLQAGGVLNAFATRFGSRNFIVLHSEMVRSCGENMDALDFIIAHELGHLHRGHLRWRWLKAPAMIVPFLGTAYYRSCEYTCDRYGAQSLHRSVASPEWSVHPRCRCALCSARQSTRICGADQRPQYPLYETGRLVRDASAFGTPRCGRLTRASNLPDKAGRFRRLAPLCWLSLSCSCRLRPSWVSLPCLFIWSRKISE